MPPARVQRKGLSPHLLVDEGEFLPPSQITYVGFLQRAGGVRCRQEGVQK